MPTEKPWGGMRLLSIANLKGGVGKSTTAMMIADTLALHHNARVLAIDLDPQSNLSRMLLGWAGLKAANASGSTLTHWAKIAAARQQSPLQNHITPDVCGLAEVDVSRKRHGQPDRGDIALVAATPLLRFSELEFDHDTFERTDAAAPRRRMQQLLAAELASMSGAYDLVLFDCPPGFSTLAQAAIGVSDGIISPLFEEPLSLWSLQSFRDFGLRGTLGAWDGRRHRALFTRVRNQGALDERREVRQGLSQLEFTSFRTSIKESAEAHRWVRRPGSDSYTSFGRKYGPVKSHVRDLGIEVAEFLSTLPARD